MCRRRAAYPTVARVVPDNALKMLDLPTPSPQRAPPP